MASDDVGRWLLVRHRGRWQLPGGLVQRGESPLAAAERETSEETGLSLRAVELVIVAWVARRGHPGRLVFVFSAHLHTTAVRLQASELEAWRLSRPEEALRLLHPLIAERLKAARSGRRFVAQVPVR
ncbi:NUDIX domain-containing protein [Sphaerisporangium album]